MGLAEDRPVQGPALTLFVTGEAPRSLRAQLNLEMALRDIDLDIAAARSVDLLREPEQAINFAIFATPALMGLDASGARRVLYGDLSDAGSLSRFLSMLRLAAP